MLLQLSCQVHFEFLVDIVFDKKGKPLFFKVEILKGSVLLRYKQDIFERSKINYLYDSLVLENLCQKIGPEESCDLIFTTEFEDCVVVAGEIFGKLIED